MRGFCCPVCRPAAALASAPAASPAAGGKRIQISPLARKIAGQMGVDYTVLTGTGPSGRIVKRDILAAADRAQGNCSALLIGRSPRLRCLGTAFPVKNLELMEGDTVKLTGMRKVVAQRIYTSAVETTVTQTVGGRHRPAGLPQKLKEGHAFSVNDFVLKAVAKALRRHPEIW
ncbi:MAG: E3 binding domain-containing protein [Dysosmobacter welbionis]